MAAGQEFLTNLAIRRLETEVEFREALDVEKRVWGFADVELVPWRLMVVATESGGLVAGGFRWRHHDRFQPGVRGTASRWDILLAQPQ